MKKRSYIRKGTYSINDTLSQLKPYLNVYETKKVSIDFYGDKIYANSQRYQTFYYTGIKCTCCGLEASFFAKEKAYKDNTERYHLNLYGINKDGKEVMFTKDHILPVSKGGRDHISNYRTMCETCNKNRGNDTKKLSLNNRVKIMANKTDIGRKIITKHIIEHPVYLV